jgi:transcriptional regulator with XRE-family HTH domain
VAPIQTNALELRQIGARLTAIRVAKGLTQTELAKRCRLTHQQINYFETGARVPRLAHLLQIARALDLPLERFLSGKDRPGSDPADLAIELRHLGLVDLWVDGVRVPGAFRPPEEVVALAVTGEEPEARIVEGVPALLAWNRWHAPLLSGFARVTGPRVIYRLAWLADVVLALHRLGGFPGGCPAKSDLERFLRRVRPPVGTAWDGLGKAADATPSLPIWKRWKINYPADLVTFRQRAETLISFQDKPGRRDRGDQVTGE